MHHSAIRAVLEPNFAFLSLGSPPPFCVISSLHCGVVSCSGSLVCEWQFSGIRTQGEDRGEGEDFSSSPLFPAVPGQQEINKRKATKKYETVGLSFNHF